jgi:hypothetical protein
MWKYIWKGSRFTFGVLGVLVSSAVALPLTLISGFLMATIVLAPFGLLMFVGAWAVPALFVPMILHP